MVRKFTASAEQLKPDTRHDSLLVSKFINCLMHDGKKSIATKVVYDAFDQIKKQIPDEDPLDVFLAAVIMLSQPLKSGLSEWVEQPIRFQLL